MFIENQKKKSDIIKANLKCSYNVFNSRFNRFSSIVCQMSKLTCDTKNTIRFRIKTIFELQKENNVRNTSKIYKFGLF